MVSSYFTSSVILLEGLLIFALDHQGRVEATACTRLTDFTCPVTIFSIGRCLDNGHCACSGGYSSGDYGCRKDLTHPYVRMTDREAAPGGTGIFVLLSLTCEPATGDISYTWRRDGKVIPESGATLTHSEMRTAYVETFRYSCQYSVNGRVTPESNVFKLQVFAGIEDIDSDTETFQPVVQGIPTTVVEGVQLRLTCANYLYHQVQRVEWILPNGEYNGIEMALKITKAMAGKSVSCAIVYPPDIPFLSSEVRIPRMSANIPHVVIKEGNRFVSSGQELTLTCGFVEEDFVTRGISLTWAWRYEGAKKSTLTSQSITIPSAQKSLHEGQWQCSAVYASNVKRNSPPIHVHVDMPIKITAKPTPARAVKDGVVKIQCEVESPTKAGFTYHWTLNGEVLMGYRDDVIYVNFGNEASSSSTLHGEYVCTVVLDQMAASSETVTVLAPISFSDTPAPTLHIRGTPQDLMMHGDSQELECLFSEEYTVPGIRYQYFQDGKRLESSTIRRNETGNDTKFTCRVVFNSLTTNKSGSIRVWAKDGPDESLNSSLIHTTRAADNQSATDAQSKPLLPSQPKVSISYYSSSTSTSLPGIEAPDTNTDTTTHRNSTSKTTNDSITSQDQSVDSTGNPDRQSTEANSDTRERLGGRPDSTFDIQSPKLIVLGHSADSPFYFNETYHLKCEIFNKSSQDGIRYEFLQDGIALETNGSDVYTLTNDVNDKEYTCRVLSSNESSLTSNTVAVSFQVFDKVQIKGTESHVTSCNARVTLDCDVILLPGVAADRQVNYTWYDNDMDVLGKSRTLTMTVSQGFLSTFHCQARAGRHFRVDTLSIAVTGMDDHCSSSACSRISVCWTLILGAPLMTSLSLLLPNES